MDRPVKIDDIVIPDGPESTLSMPARDIRYAHRPPLGSGAAMYDKLVYLSHFYLIFLLLFYY